MLSGKFLGGFIAVNYVLTALISGGFIIPAGYILLLGDFIYLYFNPSSSLKFTAFRTYFDVVAHLWFSLTVWLMGNLSALNNMIEVASGIKMVFSGDLKKGSNKSPCLIILNHRTRLDWLFMWCFLFRFGNLSHEKIILKDSLKRVPGVKIFCNDVIYFEDLDGQCKLLDLFS